VPTEFSRSTDSELARKEVEGEVRVQRRDGDDRGRVERRLLQQLEQQLGGVREDRPHEVVLDQPLAESARELAEPERVAAPVGGVERGLDALERVPEMLLDPVGEKREHPRVGGLPRLAPLAAREPVRVVELLHALERERLAAQRQADAQDRLYPVGRVVLEVRLAPFEDLEEELAGEVLDAQRQPVERVVTHLEDEPGQVLLGRHVAREQLVERRGRQRAAAEEMHAETVAGKRAGHVDDLAFLPVEGAAVVSARDDQPAGTAVQLHPLEEVRESEDLQPPPEMVGHG